MFGIWNSWSKSKKSQKVCFGHIVVVLGSDRSWFDIDRPHCDQDHAESKPAHAREIRFHTYYSGKNIIKYYRPMLNFPRLKREKGNVGCDAYIERAEITLPSKNSSKSGVPVCHVNIKISHVLTSLRQRTNPRHSCVWSACVMARDLLSCDVNVS